MLDALLDFFVRGKGNTHHEGFIFDIEVRRLDKMTEVQESKFVPFLLCFTKRVRGSDSVKLSVKEGVDTPSIVLDEAELRRVIKVQQYEASILVDIREFKKGQVF